MELKNCRWIWIGVDKDVRQYIDMVVGDRSTKTGSKLWNKIKGQTAGIVTADYWRSYNEIIPEDMLIQTQAETYTVESYHGLIRHFLALFRRKTKCYSKSHNDGIGRDIFLCRN